MGFWGVATYDFRTGTPSTLSPMPTPIYFVSAFKRDLPSRSSPREESRPQASGPGLCEDRLQAGALPSRGWGGPAVPQSPTQHACSEGGKGEGLGSPGSSLSDTTDLLSLGAYRAVPGTQFAQTHMCTRCVAAATLSAQRALSSGLAGDNSVLTENEGSLGQASGGGGPAQ